MSDQQYATFLIGARLRRGWRLHLGVKVLKLGKWLVESSYFETRIGEEPWQFLGRPKLEIALDMEDAK